MTQLMKGWVLDMTGESQFEIRNPGPDGKRQYYIIRPGAFSPVIEEDPDNAVIPPLAAYEDATGKPHTPNMKIVGVICKSERGLKGKVLYRSNLTNFSIRDGGRFLHEGLMIEVKGAKYRLEALVAANKNRIIGLIALYLPVESDPTLAELRFRPVQVLELEDVI